MNWIDRRFKFNFPVSIYPELIKRLYSTPSRLEALISEIPPEILTIKRFNKWSIQENIGHLLTVESLFAGRLDDYIAGAAELRPAQVNGRRTDCAEYNTWRIEKIVGDFKENRLAYVKRLNDFRPEFFENQSRHPRLAQPMRVCDMLYFQAEHDDHHINKIRHLIKNLTDSS